MEGWRHITLSEVAKISAGNSAPQDKTNFSAGSIPFIRTSDVGQIGFGSIESSRDKLNQHGAEGLRNFPPGTILFPKSGASTFLNHRVIMKVNACVASHLATIQADHSLALSKYLLYFLSTVRAQDLVQDHNYPSLNLGTIKDIQIPLPPLPEQERIVAILDEAFAAIETATAHTEKNLANARELFESFLDQVFTEGGTEWGATPLGEIAQFRNGANFSRSSLGKAVKVVGVGDFLQRFWVPSEELETKTLDGDLKKEDELREGDYLFVRSNGNKELIGRCMLMGMASEPIAFSGFTIRMRLQKPDIHRPFLCWYLKSRKARSRLTDSGDGAQISNLNQGSLAALEAPLPKNVGLQEMLAAKLDQLALKTQSMVNHYQIKIAKLSNLKQSLLQKAFTGELTADKKAADRTLSEAGL